MEELLCLLVIGLWAIGEGLLISKDAVAFKFCDQECAPENPAQPFLRLTVPNILQ